MFRTLLMPVDGVDQAARSLSYVERLAGAAGGRAVVLGLAGRQERPDLAEAEAAAVAEELCCRGIHAEARVSPAEHGAAAPVIVRARRDCAADLIVVGLRGGPLGRTDEWERTAAEVLRACPSPLLLIPPGAPARWPAATPLRVLVPLDGSPFAEHALGLAAAVAAALPVHLLLLEIVEPAEGEGWTGRHWLRPSRSGSADQGRPHLEPLATRLAAAGQQVVVLRGTGETARAIGAIARAQRVDLVAMATHGRTGLARLLLGSVEANTWRGLAVPLLLVRPGPGER